MKKKQKAAEEKRFSSLEYRNVNILSNGFTS
jgi:hypothetical protein